MLNFCILCPYDKCNDNAEIMHIVSNIADNIIWAISRIMLAYLVAFTTCVFLACGLHLLVFFDPLTSPLQLDIIGKMYINFFWNLCTNESFKFILFANACMRNNLFNRILNVAQNRKQKVQVLVGLLHHLDKIFKLVMGSIIFSLLDNSVGSIGFSLSMLPPSSKKISLQNRSLYQKFA
jgi:hypothetical protein